ncbi:MAG TPA: CvpA family protein [Xanthobacteraceae bacterium]|nr:CvpA family protein [Xanthobacteraceae bacterium]
MPITWLDILLLTVMLVSGVLAMIRGFIREVLSITAWVLAAVATVLLYERTLPLAEANLGSGVVSKVVVIVGVFLLTLIIASIITARISDMILDSRIGALDRTLGLFFGLARGLLIVVVAFYLFTWFVPANKLPEGVRDAKSREALQATGKWLQSLLPQDMDSIISNLVGNVLKRQPGREETPEPAPGGRRSERGGAAPGTGEQVGYGRADRADMRQLIQGATR